MQTKRRYASEKAARAALAEIQNGVAAGMFVSPSDLTVEQACASWLAGRHRIRPTTRAAYEHALRPLRQRHGDLPVQKLTKAELDQLVSDLRTGHCSGQRRKWGANSINPMLNLISQVLGGLVKQGVLVRDVAALVDRLPRPKQKMKTFTEAEVQAAQACRRRPARTRLAPGAVGSAPRRDRRPAVVGCRPGRGHADDRAQPGVGERAAMDSAPKTDRSARMLPLTPALTAALRRAAAVQKTERLALGPDYGAGEHVVCDQAGRSYHPDSLSDFWRALCTAAGVPRIRLHDARHTCATLMHLQGVPIVMISAWLGHADPAFTMRTYMHTQADAMTAAAASLQRVVTLS